jgi:hypothetical protein
MEWEPTASELFVNVACALPLRLELPKVVDPSLKVTVPVGVRPLVAVTVTVKTTAWPKTELGTDEVTVVVVAAALTVSVCVAEVIVVGEVLAAVIVGVPALLSV